MDVLALDMGGTNCRAAVCRWDGRRPALAARSVVPTAEVRDERDLAAALRAAFGDALAGCRALCAAVAGPVSGGRASLSNADASLSEEGLAARLGMPARLVNDFSALCLALDLDLSAELVSGTPGTAWGARAVVGAGTGFGCALLPQGGEPAASEGGHAWFPFQGEWERGYEDFLLRRTGRDAAQVEDVVSGRGLEALAAYVSGRDMDAAEAAALYLGGDENPVAEAFSRFYGRACRNYALCALCAGGLWIAGGVAQKNPSVVRSAAFRDGFVRGPFGDMLARLPVRLLLDGDAGLLGAAKAALGQAGG